MRSNSRRASKRASEIRTTLKSCLSQLDNWESSQTKLANHRAVSLVTLGSQAERVREAQHRARTALGTHGLQEPPCQVCGCTNHLPSDECSLDEPEAPQSLSENPSDGIHRGILHRAYLGVCELYLLQHPRFFPGPVSEHQPSKEGLVLPVPLTGPDYQAIAISQAAAELLIYPGFDLETKEHQTLGIIALAKFYYSKAFPLTFTIFVERVTDKFAEAKGDRVSQITS
jgi:hypothetical protein